jgi:hypothetical protein
MYTEQMTQGVVIAGTPVHPQQLTATTTLNSGGIDLSLFRRALFVLDIGTLGGTAPTVSAVLQIQESADNATWSNNPIIPTMTLSAGSNVGSAEIRAGQLSAGKRYARAQIVFTIGGTSPTVPVACLPLGGECDHKPGSKFQDASVVSQQVVN